MITLKEGGVSKGLGAVQRRILERLNSERRLFDTFELAADAFCIEPDDLGRRLVTDSAVVSTRRALENLPRKRLAFSFGRAWRDGRQRWASEVTGLLHQFRALQELSLHQSGDSEEFKAHIARFDPITRRLDKLAPNHDKLIPGNSDAPEFLWAANDLSPRARRRVVKLFATDPTRATELLWQATPSDDIH